MRHRWKRSIINICKSKTFYLNNKRLLSKQIESSELFRTLTLHFILLPCSIIFRISTFLCLTSCNLLRNIWSKGKYVDSVCDSILSMCTSHTIMTNLYALSKTILQHWLCLACGQPSTDLDSTPGIHMIQYFLSTQGLSLFQYSLSFIQDWLVYWQQSCYYYGSSFYNFMENSHFDISFVLKYVPDL